MSEQRPFIVESKDGWSPSLRVIRSLQAKARKIGLFANWPTIAALENHDLLLDCEPLTGDNGADLIACKTKRGWRFKVDGDYVHEELVQRAPRKED
jgi:hypothetical protein